MSMQELEERLWQLSAGERRRFVDWVAEHRQELVEPSGWNGPARAAANERARRGLGRQPCP